MFNPRLRKSMAALLSAAMLTSLLLVPAGASAAVEELPVTNPGFEEPVQGKSIPGWTSMFAVTDAVYYEHSLVRSSSGAGSLKLVDTLTNQSVALMSDKLPVTPGISYTAEAKLFIESGGTASLNLRYFNASDKSVGELPYHADPNKGFTRGQWNPVVTTMKAPADAAYARIIAYTTAYSTSTAYYDDIAFRYEKPEVHAGSLELTAPSSAVKGQEITATVRVSDVKDLSTVAASVYYDKTRLQVMQVTAAGAFAGADATFSAVQEEGGVKLNARQNGAALNDATDIAVITFKVLGESGGAWAMLGKGAALNGSEALKSDQVVLIRIGNGNEIPGVNLSEIKFGEPEYKLAPIADAVGVMDGEAGIEDGKNVMYTTVKGIPPMLHVVDLDDYQLVRSLPLEGGGEAWNHAIAPDGTVYLTSAGQLWAYSPVTKQAEKVFTFGGESTFWCLAIDEQGMVYVGTGPGGKVLRYDPVTKQSRDYGRLITDVNQVYVRSIDYSNGYIYAGTSHSKVYKLNVVTGEKEEIAASLQEKGYVYDLNIVDDKFVIVRFDTPQKRYIYDIEQGKWLDLVIENSSSGLQLPKQSLNGKIYFPADKKIKTFDVQTHAIEDSGMVYETAFRGANWVQVDDPDLPGTSLVTMNFAGIIVFFNPQTNIVKRYNNLLPPNATITNKFESGPDGKIYVTGMQASKASAYDIATNTATTFPMGQAGAVVPYGNKLYFGVYPGGDIFEYNLSEPVGANNPKRLFYLHHDQDRIGAKAVGDGKIYFGSVATYGALGGAVTVFDPANPDVESSYQVYRNIVQDQSVISLAYRDGKLYGSTSINGGVAADPKADEAKLFVWDTAEARKLTEVSLDIPGLSKPPAIGGLVFGPDGLLWGGANGYVFAMDPESLRVVKYQEFNPQDNGTGFRWGSFQLKFTKEGLLLANLGKKLYAVDPQTLESKLLVETESFTVGEDGHIYYAPSANRTLMYRITINADAQTAAPARLDVSVPAEAGKGEEFTVALKAAEAKDLYSIQAALSYDAARLELLGVEAAGPFAGSSGYLGYKKGAGSVRITATQLGANKVQGDHDWALLRFKALDNLGTAEIRLSGESVTAFADADETGKLYPLGDDLVRTVTIKRSVAEDVNDDGRVDLIDVVTVAKLVGAAVNDTNRAMDINGDGLLDVKDVGLVVMKMYEDK
ncbi:Cohesin domain-containing protein [Paenibacillus sp. UNCCL117]|uniref:cohesin domain-containing protein n=1 Tax=unclassified Paenibacillus TaxID=185978 RepID=UPI000889F40E|nr:MULTISPECIES: cohesin domain-containing protein [unclassified Paenibacillus]SDC93357.1 Cohesin domain-containing protein [Paenibacillus sp. cl123]SFW29539.1 Cohesin domain-containing protein [Paenibacillus sp. UNCCL117]